MKLTVAKSSTSPPSLLSLSLNNKALLEEVEDGDIGDIVNIEIGDLVALLGTTAVGGGQHNFFKF